MTPFSACLRIVVLVAAAAANGGCYYLQAAGGQLEVLSKRTSIDRLLDDPDTPDELARRLELVKAARAFSVEELGLPDNDSYTSFSDLDRDYVVWNVVAAGELSVNPKTWCFPVAGCVAYRGYFSEQRAWRKAGQLEKQGYDTFVGGATAYSTLGMFSDPVLSTMLARDDTRLVALLFHELAHQVLYVKGDTSFNESFATAVEELGIERWLEHQGRPEDFRRWRDYRDWADDLTGLALAAREDLAALYSSELTAEEKRRGKAERFEELTQAMNARARAAGIDPTAWWQEQPLNNARLASWSAYDGRVPAFRRLFRDCREDFECFYAAAAAIGELPAAEREARLEELNETG